MTASRKYVLMGLLLAIGVVHAQTSQPKIGYLFPAGAQRGDSVDILVGGQQLRQATEVLVSGEGVKAEVVRYIRPLNNIQREQRELLQAEMKTIRDKRLTELHRKSNGKYGISRQALAKLDKAKERRDTKPKDPNAPEVKLPEHPLLMDFENLDLRELAHLRSILFFPRNRLQMNRQLAEMVIVRVTVDSDAAPGNREMRLATKTGMTNPVVFQIGLLPETRELEPNDKAAYPALTGLPKDTKVPPEKPLSLPVLVNGQIMPGDVDRFQFLAKRGQKLVIDVRARQLIPYLADAVPGWFQATVSLYDSEGKEVAFADDYQFHPDPVLFYEIPKDGAYELEVRDSIYRGREDFVYRVAAGELPFVTQAFPLGGRMGVKTVAAIDGWNLPKQQLTLGTQRGDDGIRQTRLHQGQHVTNAVSYAVDVLPEANDAEENDTPDQAQPVEMPKIINGRIDQPGDVDVFKIQGRAGGKLVVEVYARQLNTPLDSIVRILDARGKVLAWNDDFVVKDTHLHKDITGVVTHHADSYLMTTLPADGSYFVHLTDTRAHGSPAHAYRLRISQPRPDFALRLTPSSGFVRPGGILPLTVHVLRKDGFQGDIQLALKDAPDGFELKGGRVPAGRDHMRFTLAAPGKGAADLVPLVIEGNARVGNRALRRRALAAEDVMQAFLYRHLLPAEELLVMVQKSRGRMPPVTLSGHSTIQIPRGGSARVRVNTRLGKSSLKEFKLVLYDPPAGLSLLDVKAESNGLVFRLKADREKMTKGFADNIIVEAIREYYPKDKNGTVSKRKRTYSWGYLPAIPIEVVN